MSRDTDQVARVIRHHSKSFSLASKLLPAEARTDAVVVYAWCRHVDDAIDNTAGAEQKAALRVLGEELDSVYAGEPQADPLLRLFQSVVVERRIPEQYPRDLITGMTMDVEGRLYETLDDLLSYCYHVAGCVGLMMCHVMGLSREDALSNAAHLGMAMQLTNICRDVEEDWRNGRLYLPTELLASYGAPHLVGRIGEPFPPEATAAAAATIEDLLTAAEVLYRSGDAGLDALSWRSALSIRTARQVYATIGEYVRAQSCDPLAGRAFVPQGRKLMLVGRSILEAVAETPLRLGRAATHAPPRALVRFPDDIPLHSMETSA